MFKFIILLVLLCFCYGQIMDLDANANKQDDLEKLLAEIFGEPTTPAPVTTSSPSLNEANENSVVGYMQQCITAAGAEGQCTIPNGCRIFLSPLKSSDKSNCTLSDDVCCGLDDISLSGPEATTTEAPPTEAQRTGCGWMNGDSLIPSKDDHTSFAKFPWIVEVHTITNDVPDDATSKKIFQYTCGGVLIHPRVVMTTAHNVYKANQTLRVRAGERNTIPTNELVLRQDRNVKKIIVHEKFNRVRQNLFYDIALLTLNKPMDLGPNVNTICLPPAEQRPFHGTRCFSSFKNQTAKGVMVEVPVVEQTTCQIKLRQTRVGPYFKLHSTFICAGGEPGKDTCNGDGGSPLMCPIPGQMGRYMASGMVSWGIGCGSTTPAVYVNVASMRSWVDDQFADYGFSTNFYTF